MAFDRPDPRLAFPILAAAALPGEADACPYPPTEYSGPYDPDTGSYDCSVYDALLTLYPHNAEAIPIDGVLVLGVNHTGAWGPAILDHATVTVTHNDTPVAGTLEPSPLTGFAVWRPQDPWTPGAHSFSATIENPDVPPECTGDAVPIAFDFSVEPDPAVDLVAPTVTGESTLFVNPTLSLAGFACCPGFAPTELPEGCGSTFIDYDPAQCAPVEASGYIIVALSAAPAATGPTAGQYYYTLAIDGADVTTGFDPFDFARQSSTPFCASATVHDFATGDALVGPETCFGQDVVSQLGGPYPIPPPDALTCPLQTCTPTIDSWDLEQCTPYEPVDPVTTGDTPTEGGGDSDGSGSTDPGEDDDDKACGGCTTTPSGGLGLLALTLLLPRRRRR